MSNSAAIESELTLPLYRMLEDEYMNLYGPLPDGYPWSFSHYHIKDPVGLIEKLYSSKSKFDNSLREQLSRLIKEKPLLAQQLFESCDLSDSDKAKKDQEGLRQSICLRTVIVNFLNSKL